MSLRGVSVAVNGEPRLAGAIASAGDDRLQALDLIAPPAPRGSWCQPWPAHGSWAAPTDRCWRVTATTREAEDLAAAVSQLLNPRSVAVYRRGKRCRTNGSRRGVVVRQLRVDRQLDVHVRLLRVAKAAELRNRHPHQSYVEVKADVGDVPGLLAAEQVGGATDRDLPTAR